MTSNLRLGILGGGFAGLYTASYVRKYVPRGMDVTLFDKNNYLLYTPVLHEMATGTVDARHLVIPFRKVIDPRLVHIRCEEVIGVDLRAKAFETRSGSFTFDSLVLAQGSETNFYCFSNLQDNSMTFKTVEDAIRLRNRLIDALERGAIEENPERRRRLLTFVVAGGGCTGVEVATEIAQFIKVILERDYPEIKREEVRIILIEAAPRILPSFPEYLSGVAGERLRRMGVELLVNRPIYSVDAQSLVLKDGTRLAKEILVWTAGVKARDLRLNPEVERDVNGRIIVRQNLEIPGYPGVYAIGDGARVSVDGALLPPTASVAVQEARYVALRLSQGPEEKEAPEFRFHYRGDMASLGFMYGVAEVYGLDLKGFPAWLLWKAFKLGMLPRYKNRLQILADWLITLAFKRDTSKLV